MENGDLSTVDLYRCATRGEFKLVMPEPEIVIQIKRAA